MPSIHPLMILGYVAVPVLASVTTALSTRLLIRLFSTETRDVTIFGMEAKKTEFNYKWLVKVQIMVVFLTTTVAYVFIADYILTTLGVV
jgi:hypothetical protein